MAKKFVTGEDVTKNPGQGSVSGGGGVGDMTKAEYDTNDNGKVDAAEQADNATTADSATTATTASAVTGVDSAGNSQYYGTDENGNAGFHDLPSGGGSATPTGASNAEILVWVGI